MANRRMFSARVTESTRFLKMPATSQNLYFHLGMKADDDGIVEAYPVMCTISASEDDLKVLVGKGFVTVLNEDLVTYLMDWNENNCIRSDRKVDSIYRDLLLSVVPDAKVKESKASYYSKKNEICQTNDWQMTESCQPNGGIGKDRLGKDRLGKDSIKLGDDRERIDYQQIADMYNNTCVSFPRIKSLSDTRKKSIKARLNSYSIADIQRVFEAAEQSDFLKGKNNRDWQANFDWMIKDANMAKILDGNYNNKGGGYINESIRSTTEPTRELSRAEEDELLTRFRNNI